MASRVEQSGLRRRLNAASSAEPSEESEQVEVAESNSRCDKTIVSNVEEIAEPDEDVLLREATSELREVSQSLHSVIDSPSNGNDDVD